jgi:hypothetical protein
MVIPVWRISTSERWGEVPTKSLITYQGAASGADVTLRLARAEFAEAELCPEHHSIDCNLTGIRA